MPQTRRTVLLASPPSTGGPILIVGDLTLPPSLNNAYKNLPGGRGRALTKQAEAYKVATALQIANAAAHQGVSIPRERWLAVDLTFAFEANNADGDNRVKLLMDAAAAALGFDDRWIQRMSWHKLVRPGRPGCSFVIEVL